MNALLAFLYKAAYRYFFLSYWLKHLSGRYIGKSGSRIRIRAGRTLGSPFKRWKQKWTYSYILTKMDGKKNLDTFIKTLFSAIRSYLSLSFSCSCHYSEKERKSVYSNLIRTRINEFIKAHGQKYPQKSRIIAFHLKRLDQRVQTYKNRMRQRVLEQEERGKNS